MKKILFFLLFSVSFLINAQVTTGWSSLQPSTDQSNLEFNPLKGIAANFDTSNTFPYSIRNLTFTLGELINEDNSYNFSLIDSFLEAEAIKGHFGMIQINIDNGNLINPLKTDPNDATKYVGEKYDLPKILSNVRRLYYLNTSDSAIQPNDATKNVFPKLNSDSQGVASVVVDYNSPELINTLKDFIKALGNRYNNDDRLFIVHFGLYGVFGEFGLGAGKEYIPSMVDLTTIPATPLNLKISDWEMTFNNQKILVDAFQEAFPKKKLVARNAEIPESSSFGFSDGLYFGASVSALDNKSFFLQGLQQKNAENNWKSEIIGGEMDPYLQGSIWGNTPYTNFSGILVQGDLSLNNTINDKQDLEQVYLKTHPTFIFQNYMLNSYTVGANRGSNHKTDSDLIKFPYQATANTNFWDNAIKATKKLGYTFHINEYNLSAKSGKTAIEVNIKNTGVAPMYANWDIELAYLDTKGTPTIADDVAVSLGTTSTWNLSSILPEKIDGVIANSVNKRTFISPVSLLNNTNYTFLLRVVNPLSVLKKADGVTPLYTASVPVRFDNATQDTNLNGWLTIGNGRTNAAGDFGNFPPAVTSFLPVGSVNKIMYLNEELQLKTSISPNNIPTQWKSNVPQIAAVDNTGKVTSFNNEGNVVITAFTANNAKIEFNIEVKGYTKIPNLNNTVIQAESGKFIDNNTDTNDNPNFNLVNISTNSGDILINDSGERVLSNLKDSHKFEYKVNVERGGATFELDIRTAYRSIPFDAQIKIIDSNGNVLVSSIILDGAFTNNTAGLTFGTTKSPEFILPEGDQTITIEVIKSNFYFNWIKFNKINLPDTTVPVITLIGEPIINLTVGEEYKEPGANAIDNEDGDITSFIIREGIVKADVVGEYALTYNVVDTEGNAAIELKRMINIKATEPVSTITSIQVYPNPISSILNIDIPELNGNLSEINFYDLQGKLFYSQLTKEAKNIIDLSKFLTKGIVIVQVISKGKMVTRKIIVQ